MEGAAQSKVPESVEETPQQPQPLRVQSIARIMKFPLVKLTTEMTQMVYTKIKENNSVTQRTLTSAESLVKGTANFTIANFQTPIEKVDNILCSGLDFVENKIPNLKNRTDQIRAIIQYINDSRPMQIVLPIQEYIKKKIMNIFFLSKSKEVESTNTSESRGAEVPSEDKRSGQTETGVIAQK